MLGDTLSVSLRTTVEAQSLEYKKKRPPMIWRGKKGIRPLCKWDCARYDTVDTVPQGATVTDGVRAMSSRDVHFFGH